MKTKPHKTITTTAKSLPNPNSHMQIERRAYEIWEASGCRHGEDMAHWLIAEIEVVNQQRPTDSERFQARA